MLAIPLEVPTPAMGSGHTQSLHEALLTERRLLDHLMDVLLRQRSGVAADDLAVIDDSVFAAQRVLRTLAEARRRRRSLMAIVAGQEDVELSEMEEVLGPQMTPPLRAAVIELQSMARKLSQELERNKQILQGAISSGERMIRTLTGRSASTPPVYAPGAAPSSSVSESSLLDRHV